MKKTVNPKFLSSSDIAEFFNVTTITSNKWMKMWVANGACEGGYDASGRFRILVDNKLDLLRFNDNQINTNPDYSTLFEFRGQPDYNQKYRFIVNEEAKKQNIVIRKKQVNNPVFSGNVNSYPTTFLMDLHKKGKL